MYCLKHYFDTEDNYDYSEKNYDCTAVKKIMCDHFKAWSPTFLILLG